MLLVSSIVPVVIILTMATSPFGGDALLAFGLGNQLARESNCSHVRPEHFLLAMLKRPEGRLPSLADALHLDLNAMRQRLQNLLRPGGGTSSVGKLPATEEAKQIRELAISEARRLGHARVASEHLLLAMLLHRTEPATSVLTAAGTTVEETLHAIARLDSLQNVASSVDAPEAAAAQRRLAELRQQVHDWTECKETRALIKAVKAAAARHGVSVADSPRLNQWLQLAYVGAITSRTCFFLGNLSDFRQNVLGHEGFLESFVDMGEGVLDATVETAMYVLRRNLPASPEAVFVRSLLPEDKQAHVLERLSLLTAGTSDDSIFVIRPDAFSVLEGSPHCYWIAPATLKKLALLPVLEGNVGTVRVGLQTSDDFRFLRLIWEVPASLITPSPAIPSDLSGAALRAECLKELSSGKRWAFYSKTDKARPWLSPLTLVVDWENAGERIKDYARQQGNSPSRSVRSEDRYFEPGFSYMLRSARITPYLVPGGVIPTAGRAQVFPVKDRVGLMGILSSNVASAVARFRGEWFTRPKFQAGIIQDLPVADIPPSTAKKIELMIEDHIGRSRSTCERQEPLQEFRVPVIEPDGATGPKWNLLSFLGDDVEQEVAAAFGLATHEYRELERDISDALSAGGDAGDEDEEDEKEEVPESPDWQRGEQIVSYSVGAIYGRWDVRFVRQPHLLPARQGAFDRMPACPPGSLVSPDGLPARSGQIVSEAWLKARPNSVALPSSSKIIPITIPDDQ